MKLLLASRSATRRRMLADAGVGFLPAEASVDEVAAKAELRAGGLDAAALACALADLKARSVAAAPTQLVLGADQTLECDDGVTLDKPRSRAEAAEQLAALSGRTHRLHSAAAIAERGSIAWRQMESVTLTMRPLGADFLRAYLDAEYDAIRHNVGGYRIEGPGIQLFDSIEGSSFAIMGLPLLPLLRYLRERRMMPS